MLKDNSQLKLSLSPYQGIYEVIIPANHLLRRIKEKQISDRDTLKNTIKFAQTSCC